MRDKRRAGGVLSPPFSSACSDAFIILLWMDGWIRYLWPVQARGVPPFSPPHRQTWSSQVPAAERKVYNTSERSSWQHQDYCTKSASKHTPTLHRPSTSISSPRVAASARRTFS